MAPRVLVVQRPLEMDDVEQAVAGDGPEAITRASCEPFDALVVDLRLDVLDGWYVLAALGTWAPRPRLVAIVADRSDATRARALGADLCVRAGTTLHARALDSAWQKSPANSFRSPTPSGASV